MSLSPKSVKVTSGRSPKLELAAKLRSMTSAWSPVARNRSLSARLLYLSLDRPECAFAAKRALPALCPSYANGRGSTQARCPILGWHASIGMVVPFSRIHQGHACLCRHECCRMPNDSTVNIRRHCTPRPPSHQALVNHSDHDRFVFGQGGIGRHMQGRIDCLGSASNC